MRNIVTSYVNPDTDGVASMCGYAWLYPRWSWEPGIAGAVNCETLAVLSNLGVASPPLIETFRDVERVVLVDTHHLRQLPPGLPVERVVEVVDHHPRGDIHAFANAVVDNQAVGAAATLLMERIIEAGKWPPRVLGRLLIAAVVSNTSEFQAPSTTERDISAYGVFEHRYGFPDSFRAAMRGARAALVAGDTREVLGADIKVFDTPGGAVAMSQIEGPNASTIADRHGFEEDAEKLRVGLGATVLVVNLVDTAIGVSRLWASESNLLTALPGVSPEGRFGWADRLLLRKVDLVPRLVRSVDRDPIP